jgi:hypothetical protein
VAPIVTLSSNDGYIADLEISEQLAELDRCFNASQLFDESSVRGGAPAVRSRV